MGKLRSSPYLKYLDPANIEVQNTIITTLSGSSDFFSIDALKKDGEWLRTLALGFGTPEARDNYGLQLVEKLYSNRWERKPSIFIGGFGGYAVPIGSELQVSCSLDIESSALLSVSDSDDWILSADGILDRLEGTGITADDRRNAVLFAETTSFSDEQKPRLLSSLLTFALEHRFSQDDDILVAVGSAVRKFAMNMSTADFQAYSSLFTHTATETLCCDIELELSKAFVWRLTYANDAFSGRFVEIESQLSDLVGSYLFPRLVLQDKYASVVAHSVIAVFLLRGDRSAEFVSRINGLGLPWFRSLIAQRIRSTLEKLTVSESGTSPYAELNRIVDELTAPSVTAREESNASVAT